jgi:ribosomal subunit interface protein
MNYTLHLQHAELSDFDKELLEKKLQRLQKHLTPPFGIHVTFERNMHHKGGDIMTCKLDVTLHSHTSHAERESDTIQNALDETIEAIDSELSKQHDKHKDSHI